MRVRLVSVTLQQDADCCDSNYDEPQEITIQVHDGGGGEFYTISTKRWAVDEGPLEAAIRDLIEKTDWALKTDVVVPPAAQEDARG